MKTGQEGGLSIGQLAFHAHVALMPIQKIHVPVLTIENRLFDFSRSRFPFYITRLLTDGIPVSDLRDG